MLQKKPPTNRKGITNIGTKDITTPASENKVESKSPNPELIKAQSCSESTDKKKVPAVLSKLLGK